MNNMVRILSKNVFRFFLILLWLVVSIFLGIGFLSIKETLGLNVFSHTGYHAFKSCITREVAKTTDHRATGILSTLSQDSK